MIKRRRWQKKTDERRGAYGRGALTNQMYRFIIIASDAVKKATNGFGNLERIDIRPCGFFMVGQPFLLAPNPWNN